MTEKKSSLLIKVTGGGWHIDEVIAKKSRSVLVKALTKFVIETYGQPFIPVGEYVVTSTKRPFRKTVTKVEVL